MPFRFQFARLKSTTTFGVVARFCPELNFADKTVDDPFAPAKFAETAEVLPFGTIDNDDETVTFAAV